MSNRTLFAGLGVAVVTPFKIDGSLDEKAFERLADWLIAEGVDYLVPCGTTGENPALTHQEHLRVVELSVKRAKGKARVLAGAGSNNTDKAVDLALAAVDLGADGILSITPYYNKPTPEGLLRHFGAQSVALEKRARNFPMILYNVPGRTGVNMSPETVFRIAREIPSITGLKEASANLDQIMIILRDRPKGFLLLSGDDSWTVPLIALGAEGVISVAGNEIPRLMKEMVSAAMAGKLEIARTIHHRILPLMSGNFIESNPIPVKAVMKMLGILENDTVRSPLAPLTEANRRKLREIIEACELAPAGAGR